MQNLRQIAKSIYYFFFAKIAHTALRKSKAQDEKTHSKKTINIVCRFRVQNGLTNGANYHMCALEKLGYDVRRIDITPAIRNPLKKIEGSKQDIYIFHCAAPQFLQQAWPLRESLKESGKRIDRLFRMGIAGATGKLAGL